LCTCRISIRAVMSSTACLYLRSLLQVTPSTNEISILFKFILSSRGMYVFLIDLSTLASLLLPRFQNVRRLSFSQKSTSSKFDQVYTKTYGYLKYQMDILKNYTFW
jgi:hypothetical protein